MAPHPPVRDSHFGEGRAFAPVPESRIETDSTLPGVEHDGVAPLTPQAGMDLFKEEPAQPLSLERGGHRHLAQFHRGLIDRSSDDAGSQGLAVKESEVLLVRFRREVFVTEIQPERLTQHLAAQRKFPGVRVRRRRDGAEFHAGTGARASCRGSAGAHR